jgi:hypothetical protein
MKLIQWKCLISSVKMMMKMSNIVKILHTLVNAISRYARGRVTADLFVCSYISYIQRLPRNYYNIFVRCEKRVLLLVAPFLLFYEKVIFIVG